MITRKAHRRTIRRTSPTRLERNKSFQGLSTQASPRCEARRSRRLRRFFGCGLFPGHHHKADLEPGSFHARRPGPGLDRLAAVGGRCRSLRHQEWPNDKVYRVPFDALASLEVRRSELSTEWVGVLLPPVNRTGPTVNAGPPSTGGVDPRLLLALIGLVALRRLPSVRQGFT